MLIIKSNSRLDENVILLTQVQKIREKGKAFFELQIPYLEIKRGELVAIVGPSGCGKSTLLDMLGLILKPTKSKQFLFKLGKKNKDFIDVSSFSEHELAMYRKSFIGYVLQTGGLLPYLSVKDNILLPCKLNGITEDGSNFLEITSYLGIQDQLLKKPKNLSGGQRQRVAIARAILHSPNLILADEPTAAVDSLSAADIIRKFKELTRKLNISLIIVTHDQNLAERAADKLFTFHVAKKDTYHTVSTLKEQEIKNGK